ncbi:Wadjet anti-phage system protein JetD domain-containing protein [Burkholderia sp. Ax-1719]|uniref:Wadjet anti-phage system protein JetD domain-containing protein n=1 Tax=Burkholderia sp. Ax-1719 TaxID=2608334 RepID=UPI0014227ADE|nr:Wadjet anti-phage system protein JetD domain-containing protein [Burkholderia sp. Ax-1719]
MTIENLTTFHCESKRRCNDNVLLIYTGWMPTLAWRAMFARILSQLSPKVSVFHWGDADEGGFRIAANITRVASDARHWSRYFRMSPSDIPEDRRRPATERQSERMRYFALADGWADLAQLLEHSRFTAEQEVLDG